MPTESAVLKSLNSCISSEKGFIDKSSGKFYLHINMDNLAGLMSARKSDVLSVLKGLYKQDMISIKKNTLSITDSDPTLNDLKS